MDFKRKVIAILLTVVLVTPFFIGVGRVVYSNFKSKAPDKLVYVPINDGTAYEVKVRAGSKPLVKVKIPSTHNGLPVVKIANSAFQWKKK